MVTRIVEPCGRRRRGADSRSRAAHYQVMAFAQAANVY